jgi:putative ABC transport system permease protein
MMTDKITYRDTEAIEKYCPSVAAVDPRTMGGFDLKYGKNKMTIQFGMGVSYNYPKVLRHEVVMGRFYTKSEQDSRKKVAVIGQKVVDKLFGGFNPIGEKMKINGKSFLVVGVFEKKGLMMGFDYDEIVAIPITTAQKLLDTNRIMEVGISAKKDNLIYKAKDEIKQLLIKRHKKEDFRLDTMEESLSMINDILGFLTLAIGGIASISLLVGGIGIMNIMLVSVNERIREIGIRKSVGATRRDIFIQFLIESVVISMTGGTIGIILGVGASMAIMQALGITPTISLWSASLAYFVSIFVGVVSGVYPATRAAALDPVEALRYE